MKVFAVVLLSGVLAAASLRCAAETFCPQIAVPAIVETAQAELTLADLLAPEVCPQLREAAAGLSLGRAPRVGSVRVLDGWKIRRRLEEFADGLNLKKTIGMQVPERIEVRSARATKSCEEVARFLASAAPAQNVADPPPSRRRENLNCAAAGGIANDAVLELTRTSWNAALQRWEFALRCARLEDCVPFLVWSREVTAAASKTQPFQRKTQESNQHRSTRISEGSSAQLVKPGQTAMLTWEQSGLRIVLPVTCLDAGAAGQFVRVRFKNAPRILQAEVVGKAMLRARL